VSFSYDIIANIQSIRNEVIHVKFLHLRNVEPDNKRIKLHDSSNTNLVASISYQSNN
jgi:hypothetical protein